jgi:hypothetical protein
MATTPDTSFSLTIVRSVSKKPIHVPDNIVEMKATLTKLEQSGDNIVLAAVLATQNDNIKKLEDAQKNMKLNIDDKTEIRNNAYGVCFNDYTSNEALLLIAAIATGNYNNAIAMVKRNGYAVKSKRSASENDDISTRRKKGSSDTLIAEIKAPNTKRAFAVEWQYAYNEDKNFNSSNPTGVCKHAIKGLKSPNTVTVRGRITIGDDDPLDWMYANPINI